ncbi:MAG TPA: hypothetical protein VNI01_06225, partial [Elusimicrobiota bacterium]|nr:hypothetical protein [Elusimicrobiota bacterium]
MEALRGCLAAALIALPSRAQAWDLRAPAVRAPQEKADPDFRQQSPSQDLPELLLHLQTAIASKDLPPKNVPGIDYFVSGLEEALRQGSDVPRDNILQNAARAREGLRLAYNGLTAEGATPALFKAHATLSEVARALSPLVEKNRDSVRARRRVADAGRETAQAMSAEPPSSAGGLVPLQSLCAIAPLEPELKPLQEKLRAAAHELKTAKSYVVQAKDRLGFLESLAEEAAALDADAARHTRERRTRGQADPYSAPLQSRDVILNANEALRRAVKSAEDAVAEMEAQLDPLRDGLRKAVDKTLEADARTQNAKNLEVQSGGRINYNHVVRLGDEGTILRGWKGAPDERRPWWSGRARMAKAEAKAAADKMEDAEGIAEQAAET